MQPSPQADKRTLLRRVTYGLTGLPPTANEMDAFLADTAPGAYERLVDRLLRDVRRVAEPARRRLEADADALGSAVAERILGRKVS